MMRRGPDLDPAQAAARTEARALARGVAETVSLSRARGQAIEPSDGAGARGPYRRLTGLGFLAGKGRIDREAVAAGELYGQTYRRARCASPIPSSWGAQPGGGSDAGRPLTRIVAHAEGTAAAERRLAALRRQLSGQPDLVAACDLICGEEKTPREAAASERDAVRLEAVLKVALDLLAAGAETRA